MARTVQAVQRVGGEVNRRENFTCPMLFFRNWDMKWGRRLSRGAILLIHTSEETLNGQGHDTEESNQEETSHDDEGKARRQGCQEKGLMQPAFRPF